MSRAFAQGADYFEGLPERDLPRYILVSDFARFRLYDLEENTETEFRIADLHKRIKHFAFIAGYRTQIIAPQNPVNIKAARSGQSPPRSRPRRGCLLPQGRFHQ